MYSLRLSKWLIIFSSLLGMLSMNACAREPEIDTFIAEGPSVVFASVSAPGHSIAFLTHEKSLEWIGVISGGVILLHYGEESQLVDFHLGRLSSSHAPGFVSESEFLFAMNNPETRRTEICYLDFEEGTFQIFPIPARFIGALVVWGNTIFYSTEHFDNTIHYVDMDDGEVHILDLSGQVATNSDFWIIDGDLVVTDGGDKGIPYRVDTDGLHHAPDVVVTEATKVGFSLMHITGGEHLERFERLLGIR